MTRRNAIAHANLGALYIRLGQPERALAAFQAAAAADPTLASAHYNLGVLYTGASGSRNRPWQPSGRPSASIRP